MKLGKSARVIQTGLIRGIATSITGAGSFDPDSRIARGKVDSLDLALPYLEPETFRDFLTALLMVQCQLSPHQENGDEGDNEI